MPLAVRDCPMPGIQAIDSHAICKVAQAVVRGNDFGPLSVAIAGSTAAAG